MKISEKAFRFSQPENGNFQRQSAILRTARKRPDLLSKAELTPAERAMVEEYLWEHDLGAEIENR